MESLEAYADVGSGLAVEMVEGINRRRYCGLSGKHNGYEGSDQQEVHRLGRGSRVSVYRCRICRHVYSSYSS